MQKHGVRAATDITGFGLLGHAKHLARGSGLELLIEAEKVPLLAGARALAEKGCLPGGAFRNLTYVEADTHFAEHLPYALKMLLLDPQTSGGLLMCVPADRAGTALADLRGAGYAQAAIIGETRTGTRIGLTVR
jgi:selenide,water dikinase